MNPAQTFLATLAKITDKTIRTDLFQSEVFETGGSITIPKQSRWPSTHAYEIHLHEIYVTGHTMSEAMMKWERTAERCLLDNREGKSQ